MIKRIWGIICSALLVAGCADSGGASGAGDIALENLLGTNTLQWQFADTPIQFAAQIDYTEQSIIVNENGDSFLEGMARIFTREDMNSEFNSQGENTLSCALTPEQSLNICLIISDSGAFSIFVFGGLVNGQADGNFEFCDVGEILDICLEESLSPTMADGSMFISNTPLQVVVPARVDTKRDPTYNTYVIDAMRYLEQGTILNDTPDGRMDFMEVHGVTLIER